LLQLLLGTLVAGVSTLTAGQPPVASSAPTGSVTISVLVDGPDRPNDEILVVVLPATYPQPVVTEAIEDFRHMTEDRHVRVEGLEAGRYFVGIVLPDRFLKEKPPSSIGVAAPAWVQNSSGVTRGYWPAYEVEITQVSPEASVTFVRVGYEPLPDIEIPHTGGTGSNVDPVIAPPDTGDAGLR
jgi:hypothetical protein